MTAYYWYFNTMPLISTNVRPPAPTKLELLEGGGGNIYKKWNNLLCTFFSLSYVRRSLLEKNTFCKVIKIMCLPYKVVGQWFVGNIVKLIRHTLKFIKRLFVYLFVWYGCLLGFFLFSFFFFDPVNVTQSISLRTKQESLILNLQKNNIYIDPQWVCILLKKFVLIISFH